MPIEAIACSGCGSMRRWQGSVCLDLCFCPAPNAPQEEDADEECEHEALDHGICMDCGEDRTEWLMAAAYDRAKDARKYGDT